MELEPLKTKTLLFNDLTLTLVCIPDHGWGLPSRMLGRALGYADDGQKLGDQLAKPRWRLTSEDSVTLTGVRLAQVKALAGFQSNASSMLFLSTQGIRKVLLRSGSARAKQFRAFLAKNGGEAFAGVNLAARANALPLRESVLDAPPKGESVGQRPLSDFTKLLSWMRKEGLATPEELKTFGFRAAEQFLGKLGGGSGALPSAPSPTPMLALPAGLKFALPQNAKPLIGDHPSCPGWLTAAEIAKPYGVSGTKIAHVVKGYCEGLGVELPNTQAEKFTRQQSGMVPVDDQGFCVFHVPKAQGYARWGTDAGGKSLWRNVWGPDAVKSIRATFEAYVASRRRPIPTAQSSFPNMGPGAQS
jgi:hypothetical protein